jgi:hypothetical protein
MKSSIVSSITSRPSGAPEDPHGHTVPGVVEAIQQLHSSHQQLVAGVRERGVRVYSDGARRLSLPLAGLASTDSRLRVLSSSPCELIGWCLTEVGGAGLAAVTIADGDNSGFEDNDVLPIGIPAGATVASRWGNGFPMVRGLSISGGGIAGAAGIVRGWLLIR